jgi:hypothetical protein
MFDPGTSQIGSCGAAAAVTVVRTADACKCQQGKNYRQGPTDEVRQLLVAKPMHLFCHRVAAVACCVVACTAPNVTAVQR